jgi:hypothetical protein
MVPIVRRNQGPELESARPVIDNFFPYPYILLSSSYMLKIAVFWVVAPCSLVEIYQRFRRPCCLHHQGDE